MPILKVIFPVFTQNQSNLTDHVNRIHKNLKNYSCDLCNYTSYNKYGWKSHSILKHAHQNVGNDDLVKTHSLIKEAQKDQMFVSVEKITI
jgi:hypothetical protein